MELLEMAVTHKQRKKFPDTPVVAPFSLEYVVMKHIGDHEFFGSRSSLELIRIQKRLSIQLEFVFQKGRTIRI